MATKRSAPSQSAQLDMCIDLPGEAVRCWRSSDNVKIILRKHRDVFFDINLKAGTTYSIESKADFYVPRIKKIAKAVQFQDGERLHLWIGREFKDSLVLKQGSSIIGVYAVSNIDTDIYGPDPAVKPEPLMIVLGSRHIENPILRQPDDPYGVIRIQNFFKPQYDPKIAILRDYGNKYDYSCELESPEIKEYACVTEAVSSDLQEHIIRQLDSRGAVEGNVSDIFNVPDDGRSQSGLYVALASSVSYISGSDVLTSNWFKESAGYVQENWRSLDKMFMRVRVEKKPKGKYKVVFKGKPLSKIAAQAVMGGAQAKTIHQRMPMGSKNSAFLDGGFARDGKSGYGGAKRMVLTSAENLRGGVKIQMIGTVIDIMLDVNDVYLKEDGSKDLSEFLGRAGVSIVKAGATAAIGSLFAAVAMIGAAAVFTAGVPVILGAVIVVAGFYLAASLVDAADNKLEVKKTVAEWAR